MVKYSLSNKYKDMSNKKMNNDVYKLRRNVMEFIYEAKSLYPQLPRINVRITNNPNDSCEKRNVVGVASMNSNVIVWIPEKSLKYPKNVLREIVFHEILHTAFGICHKKNGLMATTLNGKYSKAEVNKMFIKEIKLKLKI